METVPQRLILFLGTSRAALFGQRPDIAAAQLLRLNHFDRAGDLILFGKYEDGKQVNFEHQVGGHGSLGGEQLQPFVMARRAWGLKTEGTLGAHDLHPLLMRMREELVN